MSGYDPFLTVASRSKELGAREERERIIALLKDDGYEGTKKGSNDQLSNWAEGFHDGTQWAIRRVEEVTR